jgi:hypothetical protein
VSEDEIDTGTSAADVVQSAPTMSTVPVRVEGQVQTRELPALAGGWGTVQIAAGAPAVRLLTADPRRKSVTLWSDTATIGMSDSQSGAGGTGAFQWPSLSVLNITACDEVWVASTVPTTVHVYSEVWAP